MTITAIPQKPSRTLNYLTLSQERSQKLPWWKTFLGDPDYRQGKRDARRSPAIWEDSLSAINQEEVLRRQEISNVLAQTIRDSRDTLDRFPDLYERNRCNTKELRESDELLPEAMTLTILRSGNAEMALSWFLLIVEIVGLSFVAKQSFGIGILGSLTMAFLITTCGALAMNKLLSNVSPGAKQKLKWIMPVAGGCLIALGLLGFVLLREVAFNATLMDGAVDLQQLSVGNLLLMAGITLGVPLMVGILQEDAAEKRKKGMNSLQVYQELKLLKTREAEWNTVYGRLEEYAAQLPELTQSKVQNRQLSYRKGFHRHAGKDPKAAACIQAMMARRKSL
jgi:hypothetical protein